MKENNGADDLKQAGEGASKAERQVPATPEPEETAATVDATVEEEPPQGRLAKFLAALKEKPAQTRESKADDRLRGLVILTGATVACLFLFFGLFTSESGAKLRERKTSTSLGRPGNASENLQSANRSPVPQLSASARSNEEPKEITEKDVLGTMRNRDGISSRESIPPGSSPAKTSPSPAIGAVNFDDPALVEAYRRQGLMRPQRSPELMSWNQAIGENLQLEKANPPAPASAPTSNINSDHPLRKSSIVFVSAVQGSTTSPVQPKLDRRTVPALAPKGTALVARLQNGVSSAAKVPAVAVIEYNYEDDGRLVVPAGTKAYGEMEQANAQGWVHLRFHTLEFPSGEMEKINASALSMERGPLKGDVSGRNTGQRFLTRALTGMGTFAAYAVGGRGLNSTLDNSVLLRERVASNVALAGEQELQRLAFQQNIVVTVPAKTRFYLVFEDAGIRGSTESNTVNPGASPVSNVARLQATDRTGFSEQELRELRQLLGEMRQMNRLVQTGPLPAGPASESR